MSVLDKLKVSLLIVTLLTNKTAFISLFNGMFAQN